MAESVSDIDMRCHVEGFRLRFFSEVETGFDVAFADDDGEVVCRHGGRFVEEEQEPVVRFRTERYFELVVGLALVSEKKI